MKAEYLAILAAATLAAAKPHVHNHNHRHLHVKRAGDVHEHAHRHVHEKRVPAPNANPSTVWVCQLGDRTLSEAECQQGLANGTLISPDGPLSEPEAAPAPSPPASSSPSPPPPSSPPAAASPPPAASPSPAAQVKVAAAASSSGSGYDSSSGQGVDSDFPDGQLDCSDFPDEYGALGVSWLGLGGWTGVQCPGQGSGLAGITNIITALAGVGAKGCSEGCYCSYACPAGYQKLQWPTLQGLTGQSVGGLQCVGGKLHKTSSQYGTLCGTGTSAVQVTVVNQLGDNVAVCRTDYPGTESETVPLNTLPGSTNPLTCPDASKYYTWEGAPTSAQYYVNNAGVSVNDACTWGDGGNNAGNWAPVNLGAGYSNGAAWLSILANKPTNPNAQLAFTITLEGDNMSGTCQYKDGQYCSGANYDDCNTDGCTVSVPSGNARYVFS